MLCNIIPCAFNEICVTIKWISKIDYIRNEEFDINTKFEVKH